LILLPTANAGFIGYYTLDNFTLVNTDANGSWMTPDGGLSLVLTGGNTGSGDPGTTDFVIQANGTGQVQFQFSYMSLDDPGFDWAGYVLGGLYAPFVDPAGTISFAVQMGDIFGFRVETFDNQFDPGILTITDFSAPDQVVVPEPGTFGVVFAALGISIVGLRRRARRQRRKESA
jgi:hypothetical protein